MTTFSAQPFVAFTTQRRHHCMLFWGAAEPFLMHTDVCVTHTCTCMPCTCMCVIYRQMCLTYTCLCVTSTHVCMAYTREWKNSTCTCMYKHQRSPGRCVYWLNSSVLWMSSLGSPPPITFLWVKEVYLTWQMPLLAYIGTKLLGITAFCLYTYRQGHATLQLSV